MRYLFCVFRLKNCTFLLFISAVFAPFAAVAQTVQDTATAEYVHIDTITFEGNRKTRVSLLLRELEFKAGDSLRVPDLPATLERNRLRLMNLGLLTGATVNILDWRRGGHIRLHFKLVETWFIYPVPLFELADRNFNVWWHEFKRSLKRVNYGIDLTHLNLSGNADQLKLKLQFGYRNKYELSYRLPPLNHRQTLTLQGGVSYSRAHEVAYRTVGNKLLFLVNPEVWQIRQLSAATHLTWRPQLLTFHTLTLEYRDNRVSDTIALYLNPNFFLDSLRRQRHTSLVYTLTTDHRDIQPYPLKGWIATMELRLNGLLPADDLRLLRLYGQYARYVSFDKRSSVELVGALRVSFPRGRPPYFNNQALGYGGNFIRGYEYYVSDGLDFAVLKTAFRLEVFKRTFGLGKFMPFKAFKTFPIKLLLTANNDLGYANDPYFTAENPLSNRLLWGYGLGMDVVAYYDKTARFEWSWNRLGQGGFFLRVNAGI